MSQPADNIVCMPSGTNGDCIISTPTDNKATSHVMPDFPPKITETVDMEQEGCCIIS